MAVFSWVTMVLHSLKLGYFLMSYLHDRLGVRYGDYLDYIANGAMPEETGDILRSEIGSFREQCDRILAGHGRGHVLPSFGTIYWDEEEASFLRVSERLGAFYEELARRHARLPPRAGHRLRRRGAGRGHRVPAAPHPGARVRRRGRSAASASTSPSTSRRASRSEPARTPPEGPDPDRPAEGLPRRPHALRPRHDPLGTEERDHADGRRVA